MKNPQISAGPLDRILGPPIVSGHERSYDCPKCNKEKHLGVNLYTGKFNCFKCNYGGYVSRLLRDLGIKGDRVHLDNWDRVPASQAEANPSTIPEKMPIPRDTINVGISAGALRFLLVRKMTRHEIRASRIYNTEDNRYLGRVIVPLYSATGGQYFQARTYTNQDPKTLNPSGWLARPLCMPLNAAVNRPVVLAEGPFDVIRIAHATKRWTPYSLLGANLTEYHLGQLAAIRPPKVLVMLDQDAANAQEHMVVQLRQGGIQATGFNWAGITQADPAEMEPSHLVGELKKYY